MKPSCWYCSNDAVCMVVFIFDQTYRGRKSRIPWCGQCPLAPVLREKCGPTVTLLEGTDYRIESLPAPTARLATPADPPTPEDRSQSLVESELGQQALTLWVDAGDTSLLERLIAAAIRDSGERDQPGRG